MTLTPAAHVDFTPPDCYRQSLSDELQDNAAGCIECKLCVKECPFLKKYGTPKHIAIAYDPETAASQTMPFECSLCGLCAAVCPPQIGLNPAKMFLEMRRESVERGAGDFGEHGVILGYERRGTSKHYSYYALPEDCDTVFFPGCTLPGTRPDKVMRLFEHLEKNIPTLGIVLDCCIKPSHDLGRDKHFQAMFQEMRTFLLEHGVKNILVACPNCYRVFQQYGQGFTVKTIYEYLESHELPQTAKVKGSVTIHDPCGTRFDETVHKAVRRIAGQKGLSLVEMKHQGEKTLCCGEGGSVGCLMPDLSEGWGIRRKDEARGTRILTYCAGCANFLGTKTPTSHIVDLLFDPEATLAGQAKVSKAPWTYLNRIRLKKQFKKKIEAAVSRERTFTGLGKTSKTTALKRLGLLALLVGIIAASRISGATQYLEQEKLRELIAAHGNLAPIIYMATYALAPALFLPGLPLTIAGGILFGPFWGVIYTIISSTIGACIAFLVSRYVGREWITGKLRSPKWKKLDEMAEQHGWKAVAFTRLIPAFPFNLLNYAFGLTRVRFSHYALATFVCMLPACIAFIVFSSSLLEVVKGNIPPSFIVGILLIVTVSLVPVLYKAITNKNKGKQ